MRRMAHQALLRAQARLDQLQRECGDAFVAYEANPSNALKKERYTELKESLNKAEDVVQRLCTSSGGIITAFQPELQLNFFVFCSFNWTHTQSAS